MRTSAPMVGGSALVELMELELLDGDRLEEATDATPRYKRPVPHRFGLLAPEPRHWVVPTAPSRRLTLWIDERPSSPRPWPDLAVRRFVEVSQRTCCGALPAILREGGVDLVAVESTTDEGARLTVVIGPTGRGRPLVVDVTVARWSGTRSELRIEPHRRRLRQRKGSLDAMHALADAMVAALEARFGSESCRTRHASPRVRRSRPRHTLPLR